MRYVHLKIVIFLMINCKISLSLANLIKILMIEFKNKSPMRSIRFLYLKDLIKTRGIV